MSAAEVTLAMLHYVDAATVIAGRDFTLGGGLLRRPFHRPQNDGAS